MQKLVEQVVDTIQTSGLVQIEVSARHVHLSQKHIEVLFGAGHQLTEKRELSQPGQYLCEERVTILGGKREYKNVAVLGPARPNTQVEISKSDSIYLGTPAPIRESGNIQGSGSITIVGPKGQVVIEQGVIIAQAHIHITPEIAAKQGLVDRQTVMVEVLSNRPVMFKEVTIRVSDQFRYRMHVDFDEANASEVSSFTLGRIIK